MMKNTFNEKLYEAGRKRRAKLLLECKTKTMQELAEREGVSYQRIQYMISKAKRETNT